MTQTKENSDIRSNNNSQNQAQGEAAMTADKLRIVACIDGSRAAPAVCDFAAWARGLRKKEERTLLIRDEMDSQLTNE